MIESQSKEYTREMFYTTDFSDNFSRENINMAKADSESSFGNVLEGNSLMPENKK